MKCKSAASVKQTASQVVARCTHGSADALLLKGHQAIHQYTVRNRLESFLKQKEQVHFMAALHSCLFTNNTFVFQIGGFKPQLTWTYFD